MQAAPAKPQRPLNATEQANLDERERMERARLAAREALKTEAPKPLTMDDLEFAEQKFTNHFVTVPAGFSPEELSDKEQFWKTPLNWRRDNGGDFWIETYAVITAVPADDAWIADYRVCRNRRVLLIPGSVIQQGPARDRKATITLPDGYVFVEAGPRDIGDKVRIKEVATGRIFERQHGIGWPDEHTAIVEFNASERFRGKTPQPAPVR